MEYELRINSLLKRAAMRSVDMVGRKFGRLRVISQSGKRNKKIRWLCLCACGRRTTAYGNNLRGGRTRSCGCLHRELLLARCRKYPPSFIKSHRTEYIAWKSMRRRCRSDPDWRDRGISICERWEDFRAFLSDMGDRPSDSHSIGRIDNDGDYSPDNCRWETHVQQANNTRRNRRLTYRGVVLTIAEWGRRLGVSSKVLNTRLFQGWTVEQTLSIPIGGRRR
jgi:hypothetical protein